MRRRRVTADYSLVRRAVRFVPGPNTSPAVGAYDESGRPHGGDPPRERRRAPRGRRAQRRRRTRLRRARGRRLRRDRRAPARRALRAGSRRSRRRPTPRERRQPERGGVLLRTLEQRRRGPCSSGGIPILRSTSTKVPGSTGPSAAKATATRSASRLGPVAHVDLGRRVRGNRVHGRSGGDERRRDGGPEIGPRERRDREHLMRELDRRVRALLGIEPGMRGASAHVDPVHRDALALGLQRAAGARLEHEGRIDPRRRLLDQRPRAVGDPVSSSVVSRTVTPSSRVERGEREKQLHDPGLHVEDARTGRAPVAHVERPACERPDRPDGVEVADEQDARRSPRTASGGGRARRARAAPHGRRAAHRRSRPRPRHTRGTRGVGGRRLRLDERAQRVDHLRCARAQVSQSLSPASRRFSPLGRTRSVPKPNFRAEVVARDHAESYDAWNDLTMARTELDLAPTTATCARRPLQRRVAPPTGRHRRPHARHGRRVRRRLAADRAHLGRRRDPKAPTSLLRALAHAGNFVAGAFDDDRARRRLARLLRSRRRSCICTRTSPASTAPTRVVRSASR